MLTVIDFIGFRPTRTQDQVPGAHRVSIVDLFFIQVLRHAANTTNGLLDAALDNESVLKTIPPIHGATLEPIGPQQALTPDRGTSIGASSPYTSYRATIRTLTLPTKPNVDIPPSPPGSPATGTDQKFMHFLDLKRQGVHFNVKLAASSALQNPSLLPKLLKSAGVDDNQQYANLLPTGLCDPAVLPIWAYKEELAKAQQDTHKKKQEERANAQRESIDFVTASNLRKSGKGGPFGGAKGRTSAAERVMAGLDRNKNPSTSSGTGATRYEMDRRGRAEVDRAERKSRSPTGRKRSHSK